MAKFFFKEMLRLHGMSMYIVKNRDSRSFSAFWLEASKLPGTRLFKVAQLESVGMRPNGFLVWMWVLRVHMIGPCHFWDASRGDDEAHAIWKDSFVFLITRIKSNSGLIVGMVFLSLQLGVPRVEDTVYA